MSALKAIIFSRTIWTTLLFLGLVGCTTPTKSINSASELAIAEPNKSIVFGKLHWLENGKEIKLGTGLTDIFIAPHFMNMEDKSRISGQLNEDGKFVWKLKAGTYFIFEVAYVDPWSGPHSFKTKAAFKVPENGKIYYLGTLRSEFKPKRDLIGGLSGTVFYAINDEGESDIAAFQEKFNLHSKEIAKSLIVYEPRLPESVETAMEFDRALRLMNIILGAPH